MTHAVEIGPFEVVRTLGAGGMGEVYEAVDTRTGERCAVKTVHSDRAMGIDALRALRREVLVLAELDHPNIVKVLDYDLECELPWFAMEYIEGRPFSEWNRSTGEEPSTADTILDVASRTTLEDWDSFQSALEKARTELIVVSRLREGAQNLVAAADWHPGPELRTRLAWLGQVARALQFLHGLNIVHGDVKPDNVLIRDDGVAVLVDFGLVSRRGRRISSDALERSLTRAQTLEYASPERHVASDYDARADLYSLGCMLYELFAGSPPFTGAPSAVAIAHVVQPPPVIQDVDEPPPASLWSLIEELLQKDPHDRTPYASRFCAVLEDHAIATVAAGAQLPEARSYLYQPGFVGFEDELAQAVDAVNRIGRDGTPALVQIIGPEGSGKSRFLLEVTAAAVQSSAHVQVMSTSEDVDDRLPFASLRPVFDHLHDMCVAERWRPSGDEVWLARVDSRFADFLDADDRDLLPELGSVPAAAAQSAIARAVVGAMRGLAGDRGIIVVVESLDVLESGSRAAVDEILRRAADEPWLVVATSSTPSVVEDSAALELELPPLENDAIATVVSHMLGQRTPDDDALALLRAESAGRPGPLVELIHALFDEELIEQDGRGRWLGRDGASIACVVRKLVASDAAKPTARIARLSPTVLGVAEVAAVFGRRFELGDLLAVGMLDSAEVLMAVSELVSAQMLREEDATGGGRSVLVFASRSVRRALYEGMSAERRTSIHAAAARVAEERDGELASLAHHLERAGEARRAHDVWLAAAEEAGDQFAPELRVRCLEGALRVGAWLSTERREELLLERFQTLFTYSSTPIVRAEAIGMLDAVEAPRVRVRVMRALFNRMLIEARPEEVQNHVAEVASLATSPESGVSVPASFILSGWYRYQNRYDDAVEIVRAAMRRIDGTGADDLKFDTELALGAALFDAERYEEALIVMEQALERAVRADNGKWKKQALARIAATRASLGRYAELEELLTPIAEFQRRAKLLWDLVISLWNIASGHLQVGRFRETRELLDEMNAVRAELGVDDDESPYLKMWASASLSLGHFDEAREAAVEALNVARTRSTRTEAEQQLTELELAEGRFEEAMKLIEARDDEMSKIQEAVWHLYESRAALGIGNLDRAEEAMSTFFELGAATNRIHKLAKLVEARILRARGRFSEARANADAVLEWLEEYRLDAYAAEARIELAHLMCDVGEPVPAEFLTPVVGYIESELFTEDAHICRSFEALRARLSEAS